jgi:uncharacterized phage protein gp47/JayE
MPVSRPSLSDLVSLVTSDVTSTVNIATGDSSAILPTSVLGVFCKAFAAAIHMLYFFAEWMSLQIFPDTAESDRLDEHAAVYNITREAATFAGGEIVVTGQAGVDIPLGTLFVANDGTQYESTAAGTTGAAIPISADTSGSTGNLASGQILSLVNPIAGADSTGTISAINLVAASDTETDSSLLARLLARIQEPPQGGALSDYVAWARSITGVTRAWPYSNWGGPGNVGLTFVMDDAANGPIPDTGTQAAVQSYINSVRPLTANVNVFLPTLLPINLTIHLSPSTTSLQAAVSSAIEAYIGEQGYPGSTLYLSKINEAIAAVSGIVDNSISSPTANISVGESQFATLGTITWD